MTLGGMYEIGGMNLETSIVLDIVATAKQCLIFLAILFFFVFYKSISQQ